jgi:hypothetical protein
MCAELGRHDIPPDVCKLIESLDGLSLTHPHFQTKDAAVVTIFDSVKTLRNMNWLVLQTEYEEAAQDGLLYPFAQTEYGLFFMASATLNISGGYSPYMGMYGDSIGDFLNRLYDEQLPSVIKR